MARMTCPQYVRSWLDAVDGDEKFVLTIGAGAINTLLLVFKFLDMSTYSALTISTVAAFITGAAVESFNRPKPPESQ